MNVAAARPFGSVRAEVLRHALDGKKPREIARLMEGRTTEGSVKTTLWDLRKRGELNDGLEGRPILTRMPLAPTAYERLQQEAGKRGLPPTELASRLLTLVLTQDMVKAVLDDEGEAA